MAVSPIPHGFTAATPYLHVRNAAAAIEFLTKAFNAEEIMRMSMPDGKIGHAEVRIGGAIIMLADEAPDWGNKSPHTLGGTSCGMCLYVNDCDAVFQKALAAGATEMRPMMDQFMAIVAVRSSIRSATCGRSQHTKKMCPRPRWRLGWPPGCSRALPHN